MMTWFRLTLVCWTLLGLLLSLPQAVGLNHRLQIVGSPSWFDRGREPASDTPTVSLVSSIEFDPARAEPFQSLVLDCALTAGNLAPPGPGESWATGTDLASASCPSSRATPTNPSRTFSMKLQALNRRIRESRFRNRL